MYRAAAEPSPLVLVTAGNTVVAHDRRSGMPVWELVVDEVNIHHGGARCAIEAERVIVVAVGPQESSWSSVSEAIVTCLDYRTGAALWERRIHTGRNAAQVSPSVLIEAGQVLVVAGGQLCAMSLDDGHPQWAQPVRTSTITSTSSGLAVPGVSVPPDRR